MMDKGCMEALGRRCPGRMLRAVKPGALDLRFFGLPHAATHLDCIIRFSYFQGRTLDRIFYSHDPL